MQNEVLFCFEHIAVPLTSTENNNDFLNIGHADTSAGVTKYPHYLRSRKFVPRETNIFVLTVL